MLWRKKVQNIGFIASIACIDSNDSIDSIDSNDSNDSIDSIGSILLSQFIMKDRQVLLLETVNMMSHSPRNYVIMQVTTMLWSSMSMCICILLFQLCDSSVYTSEHGPWIV